MELVLTIIAGFGVLLFLIGYLGFVFAGFKHHFVTGIIAALPVLNIVTIPALWYKTSKKLLISVLGIAIIGASWFMGADKGINKTIALLKGEKETVILSTAIETASSSNNSTGLKITSPTATPAALPQKGNQQTASKPYASKQRYLDESNLQGLPGKALYRISFESIPIDKISVLKGRTIKVTTNSNEVHEGRVTKASNSSVFLQSGNSVANELPIANIKLLELMVKKAN